MRTFIRHNSFLLYVAAGWERVRDVVISSYWAQHFHVKHIYIRKGAYLRGTRHMRMGEHFDCGQGLWLEAISSWRGQTATPEIIIGDNVSISFWGHIAALSSVRIGNGVMMGSRVTIIDHNHGSYSEQQGSDPSVPPAERPLSARPIVIEDNVWLADGVVVTGGSTIGEGSIIGANAVVTGSIPAYCIAVGIPARPVKRFDRSAKSWVTVG
jgi:lipopolysaccharide O-acetyltransferase